VLPRLESVSLPRARFVRCHPSDGRLCIGEDGDPLRDRVSSRCKLQRTGERSALWSGLLGQGYTSFQLHTTSLGKMEAAGVASSIRKRYGTQQPFFILIITIRAPARPTQKLLYIVAGTLSFLSPELFPPPIIPIPIV